MTLPAGSYFFVDNRNIAFPYCHGRTDMLHFMFYVFENVELGTQSVPFVTSLSFSNFWYRYRRTEHITDALIATLLI